jgi:hypothetical protein
MLYVIQCRKKNLPRIPESDGINNPDVPEIALGRSPDMT